jgi:hypothetical protein
VTGRPRSAWAYALHPVAILVVGFHGQFDSVALLALACALRGLDRGTSTAVRWPWPRASR